VPQKRSLTQVHFYIRIYSPGVTQIKKGYLMWKRDNLFFAVQSILGMFIYVSKILLPSEENKGFKMALNCIKNQG
jgi:lipid-A-disaccharide synthase-like uncharacterized protein